MSRTNPVVDGVELNPEGGFRLFTIKITDPKTTEFGTLEIVPVVAEAGDLPRLIRAFQITGAKPRARTVIMSGRPEGSPGFFGEVVTEVFLFDGDYVLQLTALGRSDTEDSSIDVDAQHVFFVSGADPFGTNPSGTTQIFSISRTGDDLRQLTEFDQAPCVAPECDVGDDPAPRCFINTISQDPVTRSILFDSDCDPLGTNPDVLQIFAMNPDGSGLRQVTESPGMVTEADGTVTVELTGPYTSPTQPRGDPRMPAL